MPIFDLIKMDDVVGIVSFYKLKVDNSCPYDLFYSAIKKDGNMGFELKNIQTRLGYIANKYSISGTKFHKLNCGIDSWAEFEIKTRHLRVYLFQIPDTGKIIVCGGKKTHQEKDIQYFRRLKNQFKEQYYGTI